jgi:hypothetical protein
MQMEDVRKADKPMLSHKIPLCCLLILCFLCGCSQEPIADSEQDSAPQAAEESQGDATAELTDMFLWKDGLYCIRSDGSIRTVDLADLHETVVYTLPTAPMAYLDGAVYYMLDSTLYQVDLVQRTASAVAACPPTKEGPNLEHGFRLETAGEYLLVYCIEWLDGEWVGSDIWCYDGRDQDYRFLTTETTDEACHFLSSDGQRLFAQATYTGNEESAWGQLRMWDLDSGEVTVLYRYEEPALKYIVSAEAVGDTVYFTMGSGSLQQVDIHAPEAVTTLPIQVTDPDGEDSAMRFAILEGSDAQRLPLLGYFWQGARLCSYGLSTGVVSVSETQIPTASDFLILYGNDCYYYDILEREIKKKEVRNQ